MLKNILTNVTNYNGSNKRKENERKIFILHYYINNNYSRLTNDIICLINIIKSIKLLSKLYIN